MRIANLRVESVTTTLRLILTLLGLVIGWSAVQHWLGPPEIVEHYRSVGLGEAGRISIAGLQTAACLGLLFHRTQYLHA
jgi:hypothetical protein